MKVDLKVTGARELERLLVKELPAQVSRRVLLSAMRKSAEPLVQLAKNTAMGSTGVPKSNALALSIGSLTFRPSKVPRLVLPPGFSMKDSAAAIAIGPLSGQTTKPLLAWSRYQQYYNRGVIKLKRGAPIGRIRHGHLVEFGFKHHSGKIVKGTRFLERAARAMNPIVAMQMNSVLSKKIAAAIKKHNSRSPVRSK